MAILVSCRHLLIPIVRFLLQFGIGYREFSEVAKKVFVDVAARDFGVRGRKTNASRIAILTGLPRKQVKRISEYEGIGEMTTSQMTQASLVLAAWHTDPRFANSRNKPRELDIEGENNSFHHLVREYGRDVPTIAMLKELARTGAIQKLGNNRVRAARRTNFATGTDIDSIKRAGAVLHHMATTITHNLVTADESNRKFERRSFTTKLNPRYLGDFKRFAEIEGQKFLELIDNWIALHEMQPDDKDVDSMIVGIGVYSFEDREAVVG